METLCRLFLVIALSGTVSAHAEEDPALSPWSFSGYGTFAYNSTNSGHGFLRELGQRAAGNVDRKTGWQADSRVALQGAYRFNPQAEAIVQTVLRDKPNPSFSNSIEWAFAAYRPTPDLQIRAGRLGMDTFLLSDHRHLDYAHHNLRPNPESYSYITTYSVDGLDVAYDLRTLESAATWSIKGQFGRSRCDDISLYPLNATYTLTMDNFWDLSLNRESETLRVKTGFASMQVAHELPIAHMLMDPLNNIATQMAGTPIGTEAAQLASHMDFKGARINYVTLGLNYDDGKWLAQGEVAHNWSDRAIGLQGSTAYLLLGQHINSFTPYFGFSQFVPRDAALSAVHDWSVLGPGASQLQAGGVAYFNDFRIEQKSSTLGLRMDLSPKYALKVQWDRIRIAEYGHGLWSTQHRAAEQIDLMSAAMNWVFN